MKLLAIRLSPQAGKKAFNPEQSRKLRVNGIIQCFHRLFMPNKPAAKNCVIPAQAGIQMIKKFPAKRGNIAVLSASRDVRSCWIPACAGMTG
jgi:hypothetical protein